MRLCRLCGQERRFVKAHAIPEAFFRELRIDEGAPVLISAQLGQFPKKSPIGVYDEESLCEECEPKFGEIDDYGINALLKRFDENFVSLPHGRAFESTSVDPICLLQFLVSVLWRASVSQQPFYGNVSLGPHEQAARVAVDAPGAPLSATFDAVLSRWREEGDRLPITAMLDPTRERWSGVNAYRLYLGRTVAYVKVDARPFPAELKALSLRSTRRVVIMKRDMSESKDFRALQHTAERSLANARSFRNRRYAAE